MEDKELLQIIQTDRIELQRTIAEGFEKLMDKFDEHAQKDAEEFSEVSNRVTVLETNHRTASKFLWGGLGLLSTEILGHIFRWLKT